MISRYGVFAQRARNPLAVQAELIAGFPHGLRTSVPPSMLAATELAECVNFQINRGGQLQTRPGLKKVNVDSFGQKIIALASANVNGENYKLVQTEDFVIHRLNDDSSVDTVGTALGPACMVGYGDHVLIADGGYLKYIDDTGTLKIAWDGGSGASFFNNLGDTQTGQINYTVAKTDQVNFTTPAWLGGFTIALTKLTVFLSETGTSANPTFTVYRTSDNAVMAYGTVDVADIVVAPGDFVDVPLTSVIPMSASTAYYIRLSLPTYSGANYVSWYLGESSIPLCSVHPGLPPKVCKLLTHGRRLWAVGAPENPGALYFNNYAPFDWSTPGYGGYITTIDDSKVTYPIGGIASYYGTLYAFGTKEWPFFLKLQGTSGSDFELIDLHQPLWTDQPRLVNIINDVWAVNESGVFSITGVNLYGDVRSYSESFAIDDLVEYHWTEDAFAGYYKDRGQLLVFLDGKTFVAHTKAPANVALNDINRVRYPWSEYQFNFTPSCCGQWEDLVIGSTDGDVYTFDETLTRDNFEPYYMQFRTKYYQSPFQKMDILDIKILIDSKTGTNFDIVAFKDGATTKEVNRWNVASALHDDTTIDDLGDVKIEDLNVAILPGATPLVKWLGFICFSYQLQIDNLFVLGSEAYIDGIVVRYRMMED